MSQEFTMSVNSSRPRAAAPPVVAALLPIIAVVFIAFLVIGLALPVLPLHVHQDLGLGTFVVGLVAGAQFAGYGFAAIALATTLIPLGALLLVAPRRPVAPPTHARPAFTRVVGSVWVPGLGLALSSVGFGAITTFIVLLFAQHGWGQAWLAFTVLSIAFMAGGPVFRHPPRRIGGARGALGFVLVATGGQARAWFAPWSAPAVVCEPVAARRVLLAYPQLLRGA